MSNRRLNEVIESVPDMGRRYDLLHALQVIGGWRALFDPFCDEWHRPSVDSKVEFLARVLRETGLTLDSVVYAFQADYETDRPDVASAAPRALCILLGAALTRRE
jgi:hypothetical protein